jgi:hypothetical protein
MDFNLGFASPENVASFRIASIFPARFPASYTACPRTAAYCVEVAARAAQPSLLACIARGDRSMFMSSPRQAMAAMQMMINHARTCRKSSEVATHQFFHNVKYCSMAPLFRDIQSRDLRKHNTVPNTTVFSDTPAGDQTKICARLAER